MLRTVLPCVVLTSFLVACGSAAPLPDRIAGERLADAGRFVPAGLAPLASDVTVARFGPVVTATLGLTLANPGEAAVERVVQFALPTDALIGRMALEVEGRWMEGEVLSRGTATLNYEGIVRPATARPRDPALLTEEQPGRWTLKVFPVPAHGARKVELVLHWLDMTKPGTWIEERPALFDRPAERWFAIVPRVPKRANVPLVVALDVSLSMRDDVAAAMAAIDALATRHATTVVTLSPVDGAVIATPWTAPGCISSLVGGGTDLGALLFAAAMEARQAGEHAEVVLMSDGRATLDAIGADALGQVALNVGHRRVLHVLGLGANERIDRAALHAIATRGGVLEFDVAALEAHLGGGLSAPEVNLEAGNVDEVTFARGVLFGRLQSARAVIAIDGTSFALGGPAGRGNGLYRMAALARIAESDAKTGLALAREAGIGAGGAGFLALENEADFEVRGILRLKAAELAVERGLPEPPLPKDWQTRAEAPPLDTDKDGVPDALDACPNEPGADRGCPFRRVILTEQRLQILLQVYFDHLGTRIQRQSLPLLDEIVKVMSEHPELSLVGAEGHADRSEGKAAERLSKARADVVMRYLIDHGVDPLRLMSVGRGATMPMTEARDADGRARNRRVHFAIIQVLDGYTIDNAKDWLTGLTRARFMVREAVRMYDSVAARKQVDAALGLAKTPAERLSLFDDTSAQAFAEAFAPVAREALASRTEVRPEVMHAVLELASRDLATTPDAALESRLVAVCEGLAVDVEVLTCARLLARSTLPQAKPLFRRRVDAALQVASDPNLRAAKGRDMIVTSAELLALDGRPGEAKVRRQELAELGL